MADNPLLDPGGDTFTVEIRYRTKEKFGNIIQKGQSATRGGQWKIQNPMGMPSCLFKGSTGQAHRDPLQGRPQRQRVAHADLRARATASSRCTSMACFRSRKNGSSGVINNTIPMTIGGKINCDQVTITCDYFSGNIDYVKLTRGS